MAHCYASHAALTGAPYSVPVDHVLDRRPTVYAVGLHRPNDDALYAPVADGRHRVASEPYVTLLVRYPRRLDPVSTAVTYIRHEVAEGGEPAPCVTNGDFAGRLVARGEWYDDGDSAYSYRFTWEGEDAVRVLPRGTHRDPFRYKRHAVEPEPPLSV